MADSLLLSTLALIHNPWRARMYLAANTAVTAAAAIPFSTVAYDPSGMCTTGAGAKFTIPVDGYYQLSASGQDVTTSVVWYVAADQNGTAVAYGSDTNAAGVSEVSVLSTLIKCVAGDTINIIAGGTTTAVGNAALTWAAINWVAPA